MGRNDANCPNGIFQKLSAVKSQNIDTYIAAGIYIYAVEEFGKLLLLKNANVLNGIRRVIYGKEFLSHTKKFKAAFDYFQANRYGSCLVLSEGDVVPSDVVWSDASHWTISKYRSKTLGLLFFCL
jgi:hypothetical protein